MPLSSYPADWEPFCHLSLHTAPPPPPPTQETTKTKKTAPTAATTTTTTTTTNGGQTDGTLLPSQMQPHHSHFPYPEQGTRRPHARPVSHPPYRTLRHLHTHITHRTLPSLCLPPPHPTPPHEFIAVLAITLPQLPISSLSPSSYYTSHVCDASQKPSAHEHKLHPIMTPLATVLIRLPPLRPSSHQRRSDHESCAAVNGTTAQ